MTQLETNYSSAADFTAAGEHLWQLDWQKADKRRTRGKVPKVTAVDAVADAEAAAIKGTCRENLNEQSHIDELMNGQFLTNNSRMTILKGEICLLLALCMATAMAQAQVIMEKPRALQGIDVVEHLGETIPDTLTFQDETGKTVKLSDYLHQGKPLILVMAYYRCPMLCDLVLNAVCESAKRLDLSLGKDYSILTVSIDSRETWELAAAKKTRYKEAFGKSGVEQGWFFLADQFGNAKVLADAIGFKYFYDKKRDEYAHPAVIVLLSPEGKITRYVYGISYKQFDLKLGLIEASQGKVGTTIDRLILSCFHYDPTSGSYVPVAMNIMRLGGVITLVVLTAVLGSLWIRESRKHRHKGNPSVDIPMN